MQERNKPPIAVRGG